MMIPQHTWVTKLFGYDLTVEYHSGKLNTVADALSRRDVEDSAASGAAVHLLSTPTFALLDDIRAATAAAGDAQLLLQCLQEGALAAPWRVDDGLLLHGARIFVPAYDDLRHQVLLLAHSAGHEGV